VGTDGRDLPSDLVDLTNFDFDRLDSLPPTVLAAALRRVWRERDEPGGRYAGFESALIEGDGHV
jgi:FXSXX-COOH protein